MIHNLRLEPVSLGRAVSCVCPEVLSCPSHVTAPWEGISEEEVGGTEKEVWRAWFGVDTQSFGRLLFSWG